jgi:uncharacterized membrane protein
MRFLIQYGAVLAAILVLDAVWLGVLARGFVREHLGYLMAPQVQWWAAAAFYLLFTLGIVIFVLPLGQGSLVRVAMFGALFGLVAYGTYDLTNQAVIRDWPVIMTATDMVWGAVLTAIAATVGSLV